MSAEPLDLPIVPPYPPMEANRVDEPPGGDGWQFEPKWDGFRCLVFRSGSRVELQSKSGQPLARYFPELVAALVALSPQRFVLDAELVVPTDAGPSFEDLLLRIHPSPTRVRRLAVDIPAALLVFDLLVDERGRSLAEQPLTVRRPELERFAKRHFGDGGTASVEAPGIAGRLGPRQSRIRLSPATTDRKVARRWLGKLRGHGFDGIVAKRTDVPYRSGDRTGMVKVKWLRTADCVVGGFRYARRGKIVGSLLLGLYDDDGLLHNVGFTSTIAAAEQAPLTKRLESLRKPPGFTGRTPGGPSRWSKGRSGEWEPVAPKLVVEVRYDHYSGGRFRHGTKLLRWRPEKMPRDCTLDQVEPRTRRARPI